jgi:hypothetical protein
MDRDHVHVRLRVDTVLHDAELPHVVEGGLQEPHVDDAVGRPVVVLGRTGGKLRRAPIAESGFSL